jgi:hypothetical protein
MSRTVIPFANSEMTMSDRPPTRRAPFGTITGSNEPLRSRGTSTGTGPISVVSVFPENPFREFPDP